MTESPLWLQDVSSADWIVERLHGFGTDVGSVVPERFDSYVRLLHPVVGESGLRRRWTEIAHENGRLVHGEMQLHTINRPPGASGPPSYQPAGGFEVGSLPSAERSVLVETLRSATRTPDHCWFAIWDGFGGLDDQGVSERVRMEQRSYLLTQGPIERALRSFLEPPIDQSANLWWPQDEAWVVATEIDLAWTYIAAAAGVAAKLLSHPRVEAIETEISHRFTHDSDRLNVALDAPAE